MRSVLDDYRSAPLAPMERALFAFVEKVNASPGSVRQEDVDEARAAGLTEEALYDAITVCALFRFFNTWVDATGVRPMEAADARASGLRIATEGYAPPGP